ncbi:MAG: plasmid recombination protein [Clostridia bacterium]|nr:plasmid recombination protein [Clostridia bacterium]
MDDYYEKIRAGKQEKLFHEIILQIGNKENMSSLSENGQLAAKVLNEYMQAFQNRNPNLLVFSAHLHMDEATPHLHIDFVPYITGSKRGLDTRVSLKQALAALGFTGGTRGDTEWSQWVRSEKEQLSQAMERHGIEWEQLGIHDEHLSVMNYKKEQRVKEVAELDGTILVKQGEISALVDKEANAKSELDASLSQLEKTQGKLKAVKERARFVAKNARHYDDPKYNLPEPKALMSARAYHEKVALPLVRKLKDVIRGVLLRYFEKTKELKTALGRANGEILSLSAQVKKMEPENERLRGVEKDYRRLRNVLGDRRVDELVNEARERESAVGKPQIKQVSVR